VSKELRKRKSQNPEEGSQQLDQRWGAGQVAVSWGVPPEAEEALMKFRIIVEPDEDGVFVATVPSLPGCVSQGATREEALRNVREAIEGYVESLRERNEPIPPSIHEEVIDVAV
jgi:predicted RNase H-like HicB family nuclease